KPPVDCSTIGAEPGGETVAGGVDLPSLTPLPTAAERAAELIRDGIFEGKFQPGTALPETALAQALQASRNTVRGAFRAMLADPLLSYEVNRGMSVRRLDAGDVRDIYRLRALFELSAIDEVAGGAPIDLDQLAASVTAAEDAALAEDWGTVGTLNLRFH